MKNFILLLCLAMTWCTATGQLQLPPSGANQKSAVTQYMGAHAHVTITYNSPDVTSPQGASRKGQIWGQVVPYGLTNLNFGISTDENPSPWRAGANENTVIEFSHDVEVEGKTIAAGRYGLHLIPRESEAWTLILSKNHTAWGSYFYHPSEDALQVDVSPVPCEYHEFLTFEFDDRQEAECTAALKWENLSIPFKISLPNTQQIYAQHLKEEMQSTAGFSWTSRDAAANYYLQNDIDLEQALAWQQVTTVNSFMGQENFQTLQTLGALQMKVGNKEDGMSTIEKAINHPSANVLSVHQMGRQLISLDQADAALHVFKTNKEKFGDIWPVNVGLARGYSAVGDYTKALEHAQIALTRAPDQLNKTSLTQAIENLKQNADIN